MTTSRFIGREEELRVLDVLVGSAGEDRWVVDLRGEPGIGKTRLIHEFCSRLRVHDIRVALGQACERTQRVPYAMVVDALSDHLEDAGPERLERFAAEVAGGNEFLGMFPSLRAGSTRTDQAPVPDPVQQRYAARAALTCFAGRQGLVLVFDDAHWADDASLDLIEFLCRHRPRAQVVMVLAYRPLQAPPRLTTLLAESTRAGVCLPLELKPLRQPEIDSVLDDVDEVHHEQLTARSLGVPAYLELLLQVQERYGQWDTENVYLAPFPAAQAVLAELDQLSPSCRAVIDAAGTTREVFGLADLVPIAGLPAPEVAAAVKDLVARDLFRPTSSDRYRFRHPLLRLVVRQSSPRTAASRSPRSHGVGLASLSEREREIADLVARGYTNTQIARELSLSAKTIEAHLTRIFAKMQASGRVALARMISDAANRRE